MDARKWTNKVIDILERYGIYNSVVLSLLNYMSDEEVKDWATTEGYFEDSEDDETYIIVTRYEPNGENYVVEVIDSKENCVDFKLLDTELDVDEVICDLKKEYNVIRVIKN